ncbi:Protein N-terminal and lysine N-methyltransferase efm7 [Cladophialophora chaetospira]|uniref:Protein N-terminal and lysine N-methyltransferase EFM7 n=1 Tax=Cladophialophora chaetospira TaxID=386627 RepID=A0AA38X292_9EURO|nr:Protein N-terminal and lysine N-methyltransferase efm7 [Cladophialophora chaetospira]
MDQSDDEEGSSLNIFKEPTDFYQPDKPPTYVEYALEDGRALQLRLIGHSPLWGHLLWNAGQVVARYLENNARSLVQNKSVLELGAGAGLPSLVAAILGARLVVVTDYPENELIVNLRYNIEHCSALENKSNTVAEGYLWGSSPLSLMSHLQSDTAGFDLLILADILFNHSEHAKLLATVRNCLKKTMDAVALVFFTPYRPWLLDKDLNFFELARADGFVVNKISEQVMDKVMFEEDPGDEALRKTVFGYEVRWKL